MITKHKKIYIYLYIYQINFFSLYQFQNTNHVNYITLAVCGPD